MKPVEYKYDKLQIIENTKNVYLSILRKNDDGVMMYNSRSPPRVFNMYTTMSANDCYASIALTLSSGCRYFIDYKWTKKQTHTQKKNTTQVIVR